MWTDIWPGQKVTGYSERKKKNLEEWTPKMLTVVEVTSGGRGEVVVGGIKRFSLLNYIYIFTVYI